MEIQYFNNLNWRLTDSDLITRVLSDLKPGASIGYKIMNKSLLIRGVLKNYFIISKKKRVKEFFDLKLIKDEFSDLGTLLMNKTKRLYNKIKGKYVADAIVYLFQVPKEENKPAYNCHTNIEKPEVALLQGLLYGYDLNEIKDYVENKLYKWKS